MYVVTLSNQNTSKNALCLSHMLSGLLLISKYFMRWPLLFVFFGKKWKFWKFFCLIFWVHWWQTFKLLESSLKFSSLFEQVIDVCLFLFTPPSIFIRTIWCLSTLLCTFWKLVFSTIPSKAVSCAIVLWTRFLRKEKTHQLIYFEKFKGWILPLRRWNGQDT